MKSVKILFTILLGLALFPSDTHAQIFKWKKKSSPKEAPAKKKDDKLKPYKDIITEDAITFDGLIKVHTVEDKSYFEIHDSLLEKEILVVSRIAGFVKNLNFGGAGTKSRPQQVIRWQKKGDMIILRSVSYSSVASMEDPIYTSVKNNNFEPVVMTFDVKTYSADSTSFVIDVDQLFTTDVDLIGAMYPRERKGFGIRGVDKGRSFITQMKSFPKNTEVKHILTYTGSSLPDNQLTGALSVEMNQSFILLPEKLMTPRLADNRVGYFSLKRTNYSLDEQKAASETFITKWDLQPKPEDRKAYFRGELVEPSKPIIYYIDPATPDKWRPYLKQGINDWNVAFEAAGFKNAITAKDPPSKEEDPDWSPEDVRYSVIRYVSTEIQNAMGPHVHDPRTGEILESDIIWYHNVMNLLRNWFFVQTAAINPDARSPKFKDEVMGRLIRFVCAHEVGHTLGMPHNMGSSVAYPVDSLRSPSFTKRMGTAPSIMDYARFNYVAQPGDGEVGLMPNIGPYDKWAIDFGYRLYENVTKPTDERNIINAKIKEKSGDPIYRFGRQRGLPLDPSSQTEDLGDNSMEASKLGIANLKKIVPNLVEWTSEETKDYSNLEELYGQIFGQFNRYMGHVSANVGGVYEYFKTADQDEPVYIHTEAAKQRDAIRFLNEELFTTPVWLIDEDILRRIEEKGVTERIRGLQDRTLSLLFNQERLTRIAENSNLHKENYSLTKMMDDLVNGIFSELKSGKSIDLYRRNLQRTFVEGLERLTQSERNEYEHSDIPAIARGVLKSIKNQIANTKSSDTMSEYHLDDLTARIDKILDPK